MHKSLWLKMILMSISLIGSLIVESTYVFAEEVKSEAGITFQSENSEEITNPPIYEPKPPEGHDSGNFPPLGQLVSSFILILLGSVLLILVLGIISFRKIYHLTM